MVETPEFRRAAKATGITTDDRERIVDYLARRPESGDLIPGTGGARKVRFRGRGHGKSGGYRVVTAYADHGTPVFLLSMFAKGDRIDLSTAERNELRTIIGELIQTYRNSQTGTRP